MRQEKQILALNAFDLHSAGHVSDQICLAVERRLRSFGSGSVVFYRDPIKMVGTKQAWMYGAPASVVDRQYAGDPLVRSMAADLALST